MKTEGEAGEAAPNGFIGTPGNIPVSHANHDAAIRRMATAALLLRFAATALCVGAFAIMFTNEQTKTLSLGNLRTTQTARPTSILAFVFYEWAFLAAGGYSFAQALVALLGFISKDSLDGKPVRLLIYVLDLVVLTVLTALTGAAVEVAYIAKEGESKVTWTKQCDKFGRFCNQVGASLVVGLVGILAFMALVTISARQLFGNNKLNRFTRRDGYYTNNV